MIIRKLIRNEKTNADLEPPRTFKEELNRLSKALIIPGTIIAAFAWILFIPLDRGLYSELHFIFFFRIGLSFVAILTIVLYFIPYFKKNALVLVYILLYYLGCSTAIILGMVGANPVYMGGFCIVILIIGWAPIQKVHGYFLLFLMLLVFIVVGLHCDMSFNTPLKLYGLANVIISIIFSIIVTYLLDRARKNSYEKSLLIYKTHEELKRVNKLRGELLEIVAHDLKDPLQVIIGYTDLLQTKLQEDQFAIEKLRKIYRSTNQMVRLITGLLEIASIESGKVELNNVKVDVGEVAGGVVRNNRPASEKKNQEIIYNAEENCIINADKMLLQQVLENLVSNAIKFSSRGKSIWVSVERKGSRVIMKVRDEGPGFTEEDKKKLFGKFQRLSAKPTGDETSSGLGLALTKELVKLHNGDIRLESQWGKGSEFIVELPTQEQEPE
jgi:signal transduction histidine kinase